LQISAFNGRSDKIACRLSTELSGLKFLSFHTGFAKFSLHPLVFVLPPIPLTRTKVVARSLIFTSEVDVTGWSTGPGTL
jgi:hypothetical protein